MENVLDEGFEELLHELGVEQVQDFVEVLVAELAVPGVFDLNVLDEFADGGFEGVEDEVEVFEFGEDGDGLDVRLVDLGGALFALG